MDHRLACSCPATLAPQRPSPLTFLYTLFEGLFLFSLLSDILNTASAEISLCLTSAGKGEMPHPSDTTTRQESHHGRARKHDTPVETVAILRRHLIDHLPEYLPADVPEPAAGCPSETYALCAGLGRPGGV